MTRKIILACSIGSYAVFVLVAIYAVGFFGNVYVPRSIDSAATISTGSALLTNFGLLLLFGLQHSGMARPGFKRWLSRFLPESVERSTYILVSSIALALIMLLWQPMGGVMWDIADEMLAMIFHAVYLLGWVCMVWATFLINHLDFFGLRQAYCEYRGRVYIAPKFDTPGAYRAIRHPVYASWLVVFWCTPVMTICHFMLSAGLTAYILLGICLEERDLVQAHPSYAQYRRKVPALIPSFRRHLRGRGNTVIDS